MEARKTRRNMKIKYVEAWKGGNKTSMSQNIRDWSPKLKPKKRDVFI
jgi:hypothetical protein